MVGISCPAGEFRTIRPIPVQSLRAVAASKALHPVSRPVVEKALKQVLAAWNTPKLREKLSERFYDAERVADAVDSVVPRDASIRLLGIRDVQTYDQKEITDPERGNRRYRVSTVAVVAETQVEFNDPRQGFRRLRGVNEYFLEVREPL
ncbi:MAG: hypothetical protein D6786_08150 [Gammaproteobacteria bacterium]|nr:MAG: hypothetical protein D6786_08150 [Gammaproteobacteria bacterium]